MTSRVRSLFILLAVMPTGCFAMNGPDPEGDASVATLSSSNGASLSNDRDVPIASGPLGPQHVEPPCDDDGDCCPPGTSPVVGTASADVYNTNAQGLCHVTLGGADVVNNTSAAGIHAALGGSGADSLQGGFGPAILAGGADNDTLNSRNAADQLYGQDGNDVLNASSGNDKGFGGPGNDSINLGNGDNEGDGGPGTDTVNAGTGADTLRGGAGNDTLNGDGGVDDLRGNAGRDTLNGGSGDDVLVGGPGRDVVNAESGNDTVIVYDVCELESGEVLNGGGGTDTLRIPISLAEVQALGVVVNGFENIVLDVPDVGEGTPDAEVSECRMCGCELQQGVLECCNDHGTCDALNADGRLFCTCDSGFLGPDCRLEDGTTYPARDCPPDEPTCESPLFSIVEGLDLDLTGNPVCDDLPGVVDQIGGHDGLLRTVVFRPTVSEIDPSWPLGELPVVLFAHGQGHAYTNYEDWMSYMAGNSVPVVSIEFDDGKSSGTRAHLLVCLRRLLPVTIALADHLDLERVSFAGHSRGGEGTVIATNLWASESPGQPVLAAASLAPALNCQSGASCAPPGMMPEDFAGLFELGEGSTSAFLSILGSRDGDVPGRGLEIYELASQEHVPIGPYMHKANTYVFQVPHNMWGGVPSTSNAPGSKGNVLARTYFGNFLRWRLAGATELRELFTSQELPACLADPVDCGYDDFAPLMLFNQYLEGTADGGSRRIIFDFSSPIIPDATFAATGPATAAPVDAVTSNSPFSASLETAALQVSWLGATNVDLEFPTPLDSDGASFLGFRIAKSFNGTANPCVLEGDSGVLQFDVTFEDAAAVAVTVDVTEFAEVTDPDHPESIQLCANDFFQTFRIPLSAFALQGVDTSQVVRISFELPAQQGMIPGKILLDTVELTGAPADAQCGNAVVESGEACDDGNLVNEDPCKADCTFNVCGDGVINAPTEECDDGNADDGDGCDSECNGECEPGSPLCRCLDSDNPGEDNAELPEGGILGDGHWCLDDVAFGGGVRCVDPPNGEPFCHECTVGQGVWCPCIPAEGCFADVEGLEGPATGTTGDDGTCEFACDPNFLDICDTSPADNFGYCFVEGAPNPLAGGIPPWFFDQYCANVDDDFVCVQEFNEPRVCQTDPGPQCF